VFSVDLTSLAAELLDRLPANRTLGLTIVEALDGVGRAVLPVSEGVRNVIGALHSSGVVALPTRRRSLRSSPWPPTKPQRVGRSHSAYRPVSRFTAPWAGARSRPVI
jgi:hypothetical protein